MHGISKSLNEMTVLERSSLLESVAEALEASADEAAELGDRRFVENSICIASTIRGMAGDGGQRDLSAAELLLEQGIMMVYQFSSRSPMKAVLN